MSEEAEVDAVGQRRLGEETVALLVSMFMFCAVGLGRPDPRVGITNGDAFVMVC